MLSLRMFWRDVKKTCESCATCKYLDFNNEVCGVRRITEFEIGLIEKMFEEENNEH